MQQKKPTTEGRKVKQDLQHLNSPPLNTKEDLIKAHPDRFKGIGHFPGTYHITLCSDAKPVIHAPRKCPIAMRPLVQENLDEFLEQGIISVEEPMDWVSSLAYSWKANGKLRVCLDPRDVNKTIKRDHYKTPTVEEITHLLAGSKKFTKVDGTSSYLCIVLDYESSLLTTFNTPWGRYRFVRLPWGLSCAQDIFQRLMDQSWNAAKELLELLMMLSSMEKMMKIMTGTYTTSCAEPENTVLCSMERSVKSRRTQ